MTKYEAIKVLLPNFRQGYRLGLPISVNLFRDVEIYEAYKNMNGEKMKKVFELAYRYKLNERVIRSVVDKMEEVVEFSEVK